MNREGIPAGNHYEAPAQEPDKTEVIQDGETHEQLRAKFHPRGESANISAYGVDGKKVKYGEIKAKIDSAEQTPANANRFVGMSVEEIARETGMGRGAIELVQQMTRRQLERS